MWPALGIWGAAAQLRLADHRHCGACLCRNRVRAVARMGQLADHPAGRDWGRCRSNVRQQHRTTSAFRHLVGIVRLMLGGGCYGYRLRIDAYIIRLRRSRPILKHVRERPRGCARGRETLKWSMPRLHHRRQNPDGHGVSRRSNSQLLAGSGNGPRRFQDAMGQLRVASLDDCRQTVSWMCCPEGVETPRRPRARSSTAKPPAGLHPDSPRP